MEKYFASHIFEENVNGIPIEVLPMSPEDKWADDRRWTTAASINGAKKNIRAKIRAALGYDWKEVQHVDMVFGPVKKEVYLGIYNVPANIDSNNQNTTAEEENNMENTNAIDATVNAYMEAAEAAATNPVPDFVDVAMNLNEEEEEKNMENTIKTTLYDGMPDAATAKKISNEILCRIIDRKTNEEKHFFAEIFKILYASGVYMDESEEFPGEVLVCKGENAVNLKVDTAIDFGRRIYVEVGDRDFIDLKNGLAIRARLTDLFKPAPAKQETTVAKQNDTVENKITQNASKEEENMKIVTGVGSREVDANGIARIREIAILMDRAGYILRSGGAKGSDSVFEQNMKKKEIYLANQDIDPRCFEIAATVHPVWNKLPDYAKRLHARNVYQVLGRNLNRPSDICVCWTSDGATSEGTSSIKTGGTRTAIVLSDRYSVPVYNLFNDEDYEAVKEMFKAFGPVNQPAAAINNAPESAVENKKEEEVMNNNPYDAIAVMKPAFNPYINVRFNVIRNGKKEEQVRSITCLDMAARQKLVREGKLKPMKLESPTYYTGSLFNGNKKVGTWAWNTVRWAFPSLTLNMPDGNKKIYQFKGEDADHPADNVSILLAAMVSVIGRVRGVKSTVPYRSKKSVTNKPDNTPNPAPVAPTPEAPVPVQEEDVNFFMN